MREKLLRVSIIAFVMMLVPMSFNAETIIDEAAELSLSVDDTATIKEERPQSFYDLRDLFNVEYDHDNTLSIDQSAVDYTVPDTYDVVFTETDENGNSVSTTSELVIQDILPRLELQSPNANCATGTSSSMLDVFGIVATELSEGDLTDQVVVLDEEVNYNKPGSYSIAFEVSDNEGNLVHEDANLTLRGEDLTPTLELTVDELGYTFEEDVMTDDEIATKMHVKYDSENTLTVDQSAIDYSTPGIYPISFTVADESGNTKTVDSEFKILNVEANITFASSNVSEQIGEPVNYIEDFGIVATEFETGDLTDQVQIDDSKVDYDHVGTYPVTFTVVDSDGYVTTENGTLNLRNDAPVIKADGEHTIITGTELTDAELIELYNVEYTSATPLNYIEVDTSEVNWDVAGGYDIIFTAYDTYMTASTPLLVNIHIMDSAKVNIDTGMIDSTDPQAPIIDPINPENDVCEHEDHNGICHNDNGSGNNNGNGNGNANINGNGNSSNTNSNGNNKNK